MNQVTESKLSRRDIAIVLVLIGIECMLLYLSVTGIITRGMFNEIIKQDPWFNMVIEIISIFAVLSAGLYLVKSRRYRIILTIAIILIFSYIHVCLIPVLTAAAYITFIIVIGYLVRKYILKLEIKSAVCMDFLLGSGILICLFCLMSAIGIGSIEAMRGICLAMLIPLSIFTFKKRSVINSYYVKSMKQDKSALKLWQSLLLAGIVTFFLIQVGRMNITLDYDSIWYGLRPEYNLNVGNGIYEDLSLVGAVYTYPKGLEVLMMPISGLPSYGFIYSFNIMITVLTVVAAYQIMRFYAGKWFSLFGLLLITSIPSLMNMAISAKTDNVTVLFQCLIILCTLRYLENKRTLYLVYGIGAFLMSLTFKTTSLIFSTAIIGMCGLYIICKRKLKLKAKLKEWCVIIPSVGALFGICMRTYLLVGVPMTSAFSTIALKLGFEVNYPYRIDQFVQYSAKASIFSIEGLKYYFWRLFGLFVLPNTENLDHVILAWGTCLITILLVLLLVWILFWRRDKGSESNIIVKSQFSFLWWVFIPFGLVNLVAMLILDKPDGNYFSAFYVMTVIIFITCYSSQPMIRKRIITIILLPMLIANVAFTALTNWAVSFGFTGIDLVNRGYLDNHIASHNCEALQGNDEIWEFLESNQDVKLLAFGAHPDVLRFPCISQSFTDVAYWGNSNLTEDIDSFINYINYAGFTYVYIQGGELESYELAAARVQELFDRGYLKIIIEENKNILAQVVE